MQQISKKSIWVIVSITILWLISHSVAMYLFSKEGNLVSDALSPADLQKAIWIGIIYSLCCVPACLVLNIPIKKRLVSSNPSKARIWIMLFVSCLMASAMFALSGELLLRFGMQYCQYLCFSAAAVIAALLWGFWETRVFKAV
jgi:hypothetical protein